MSLAVQDSSEWLTAIYEIDGPEALARRTAERICIDQTIEAESNLLPPSLHSTILGQLEDLRATAGGRYHATIRFRGDLLSGECSDLLNVLFGTSSLRGGVTLLSFTMTNGLLSWWPGATIWGRWTQASGRSVPSPTPLRSTEAVRPHSSGACRVGYSFCRGRRRYDQGRPESGRSTMVSL
jgi:hypothetical protein